MHLAVSVSFSGIVGYKCTVHIAYRLDYYYVYIHILFIRSDHIQRT